MSVKVSELSKSYGTQLVLDKLTFEATPGRVLGFLGPNGAGKSTTMKILVGTLMADHGTVEILGQQFDPEIYNIKNRIGYLSEHNPLYLDMYVLEFLEYVANLHALDGIKDQVRRVVEMTGLGTEQHKKIAQLSKGYRQRVGLAQAIIHNPDILILDEPTTGLDPNQLLEIRQLIRQLGKEKTVLFSTHIMQEVDAVCDDVVIIDKGKIVADCPMDQLNEKYQVSTAEELFIRLTASLSN